MTPWKHRDEDRGLWRSDRDRLWPVFEIHSAPQPSLNLPLQLAIPKRDGKIPLLKRINSALLGNSCQVKWHTVFCRESLQATGGLAHDQIRHEFSMDHANRFLFESGVDRLNDDRGGG